MVGKIRIAIDRGGTFTDVIGNPGTGNQQDDVIIKLLSVDPKNYPDAPLEGIRRLLEIFTGETIPRGAKLDTSQIESIRMGTTVATNALLERKGERCALITTKGFKDCLVIGNQTRPKIFDLKIKKPEVLYETVVEVDERVTLEDYAEDASGIQTKANDKDLILGTSGETVRILKKPDVESITSSLQVLYASGIRSIGIALLHSYTYPEHEKIIGEIATKIGFTHISLSSELIPMIKLIPRANSSIADAYLTPEIKKYLNGFTSGLNSQNQAKIEFMKSDGGLVDASKFSGLSAILSGPAGGVVGGSSTCYDGTPLVLFDMGGTSTDVSRYGGQFEHVFETTTAGVTIQSPQLDINTVAAGGGSKLFWSNGLFKVGPESGGAHPGPSCYKKGGDLTVTDANLILGRLLPEYFPKIFGPNEDEPLDEDITLQNFTKLTKQINIENGSKLSVDEVAYGFIKVANETMARPIRQLTEAKGYAASQHRLVTFGGAGGQHAVAVAESLGIDTVLAHRYSSVLSAYGIALADVVEEIQEPSSAILNEKNQKLLESRFDELKSISSKKLIAHGFKKEDIYFEKFLNLRYQGTESSLMISQVDENEWDFEKNYLTLHKREFGFLFEDKEILVDDIRVRAIGNTNRSLNESVDEQLSNLKIQNVDSQKIKFTKQVFFEGGRFKTPVFRIEELSIGDKIKGPALLVDNTQTNLIPPNASATILKSHVFIKIHSSEGTKISKSDQNQVDPILLSIFGNRFMDIAEQMGTQLRQTSVSTNVKERLDFSCALFDPEGRLVANAPHVPVHLGSMSTCINIQAKLWEGKLKKGDVLLSNHPLGGNTHLPDLTVITPAFSSDGKLIFYVASRAHHSDIGGVLPGSMPPNSKELYEEGATFYSELLVSEGKFNEEKITKMLLHDPAQYEGCSGTRKLSDNLSDLKAQISANQKGINLIERLVDEFTYDVILFYMNAIQDNAANTVQKKLIEISEKFGSKEFESEDFMDEGSKIKLKIKIDPKESIFDFTGTSPQMYGNLNAPEAITNSALLYCLRCLVDQDIPLNQGCLRPVKIIIPYGSILSPLEGAAVVGGNVMTSQRVTDVILKAFKVMADSQGDCNNLTFGTGGNDSKGEYTQGFGYYETIGGGHGAGDGWNGISGVHTNMTNTRMTDVEVLEKRYPVILREYSIRTGSGGEGKFKGGDGVIRDIEFRKPVKVSILSERRVNQPQGIEGGENGERGLNLWIKNDGHIINIGGRNTVDIKIGERIVIKTPGGGGYGIKPDK
ncbi:5-oxoprolinase (ATP-hydrolysing) [Wickerhamomyces ciferrii]|uniref:5-oxoprolinase (ATP-hydrolysing) n=1 Tax=Wickerhamomyces ciferrii (strain ATCC 14091 / BCRC 22168 / CBS 111 / JCM 3599 / NBRC 0793 / NRRL Y-1031 F-60-10) TaxID=1206466 RepID=K0KU65_WICCF|nr:5-oxoprolinase (ATP-hydrolyzing) [Wickerhamomyces ciferrii]CCH44964.1 5-oxoprolinase (ATP-hydrolysing) [Wickerhamomyces ciferrii]